MANYSLHAYDADVWIPSFTGLNQYGAGDSVDTRFATEAVNVETPGGVLQPAAKDVKTETSPVFDSGVGTLMKFFRRLETHEKEREVLIIASGGKLYYSYDGVEAYPIDMPLLVDSFQSDHWSYVTYEAQGDQENIDVLIISNAEDGMFMVVPPDRSTNWGDVGEQDWSYWEAKGTWSDVKEKTWTIRTVDTRTDTGNPDEPQKKFAFIERFNERIWGGGWTDYPDTLYYSRAYDPTDWTTGSVDPADDAGDNRLPSWDGDRLTALKRYGDSLIAFREHSMIRITGTDPSSFYFSEQYGSGCPYPDTIVVDDERLIFAEKDGISYYDGQSAKPFMREFIEDVWAAVNRDYLSKARALMTDDRYYLSVPYGGAARSNMRTIIYSKHDNSFLISSNGYDCFTVFKDKIHAFKSFEKSVINYDSWSMGKACCNVKSRWVSPWMDFGYKRIVKGGIEFYFTPEVKNGSVTFTISFQTEKKTKVKNYIAEPPDAGKQGKTKRLHFSGTGRKFRVMIEADNKDGNPWRLVGGIQMVVETDPD